MPPDAKDLSLTALPADSLSGSLRVPGDKSISHRALLLGALAVGESRITGLLEGEDVLRTAKAVAALGAEVSRDADGTGVGGFDAGGTWSVYGRGIGGLAEPDNVLDMGNSGTGARLLLGLLASHPLVAVMTGDASLRGRPMARVTKPLAACGARFVCRSGDRLPITVIGSTDPLPLAYRLPVASAQVKSALLLAGLNAPGITTVEEPTPTRDHSELMLRHFGADVGVESLSEARDGLPAGARIITLAGQPELTCRTVAVPSDPSSAAFPMVAALLLPGSDLRLTGVGLNPQRIGLIETLSEMGADIVIENRRQEAGEPVGDLHVRASRLRGIEVPAERAPAMIDEYPILAVAAACAEGKTVMHGLAELRVKESDRLAAVAEGLRACGISLEEGPESLSVEGSGGTRPPGGAIIQAKLDHRIAMSFLVLGLAAEKAVTIDDATTIETSFPGFAALMTSVGGRFQWSGGPAVTKAAP